MCPELPRYQREMLGTHGVNDDVDADFVCHKAELRRITRVVDPLPSIAKVTVAREEDH